MSSKDTRFRTRRSHAKEGDYVSSSGDEREEVYSNAADGSLHAGASSGADREYHGDVHSGDESYREEFYTGRESSAREEYQPMPYLAGGGDGDDVIDDSGLDRDRAAARGPVVDEADIEKMFVAARHGKHKELKVLLDKGIPPNVADQHGNTILIIACQNGNKRVVRSQKKRKKGGGEASEGDERCNCIFEEPGRFEVKRSI
jgi:hypothetical protein